MIAAAIGWVGISAGVFGQEINQDFNPADWRDRFLHPWRRKVSGLDQPRPIRFYFFPHGLGLSYGGSSGYPNYPTYPYERPFRHFPLNEAQYITPSWGGLGFYKQGYAGDECRPVYRWLYRNDPEIAGFDG
jgi:hypothetical protein